MTTSRESAGKGTISIRGELLERVRDAVVQLSGPEEFMTLTSFLEAACETELARLQRKYNKGKPFPARKRGTGPKRGRPLGA